MKKDMPLRITNTLVFALMVTVNVLANALPIGGFNTGQISAMYPTPITPPGWTFSIWGVIYGLFGIVILRQLFSRSYSESLKTGPWFLASCLCNIAWIFAWHTQHMVLAAIAILGLLATLWKLYGLTRKNDFVTKAAFGIYYAWITVATALMIFAAVKTITGHAPISPIVPRSAAPEVPAAANAVSSFLDQFTGIILVSGTPAIVSYVTLGEYILAIVFLVILAAVAAVHTRKYADVTYLATFVWALAGVIIRQITSPTPPVVLIAVCALALIVIIYFIMKSIIKGKENRNENNR